MNWMRIILNTPSPAASALKVLMVLSCYGSDFRTVSFSDFNAS